MLFESKLLTSKTFSGQNDMYCGYTLSYIHKAIKSFNAVSSLEIVSEEILFVTMKK